MCLLKPLRVKKIKNKQVVLDNGIRAHYDRKIGKLKLNDQVMVYGNLVLEKINDRQK